MENTHDDKKYTYIIKMMIEVYIDNKHDDDDDEIYKHDKHVHDDDRKITYKMKTILMKYT